jgi:hypothetical protein
VELGEFLPVVPSNAQFVVCWYGTEQGQKKVTCQYKVAKDNAWLDALPVTMDVYGPVVKKLDGRVGQMGARFALKETEDPKKKGAKKPNEAVWGLGLADAKPNQSLPGMTLEATAEMPAPFGATDNIWSYVQLVKPGLSVQLQSGKTASFFSRNGPLSGKWILDGGFPIYGWFYKIEPKTQRLRRWDTKAGDFIAADPRNPGAVYEFVDTPGFGWSTALVTPGDFKKGVLKGTAFETKDGKNTKKLGEINKVEFKDQQFKTFVMFQSKRIPSYAVPITVYSGWSMDGVVNWNAKSNLYDGVVASMKSAVGQETAPPIPFGPIWDANSDSGFLAVGK